MGNLLFQTIGFRAFVQKNVTRFSFGDEVNEKRFRSVPTEEDGMHEELLC